ncbi:MAG TPA: hypothetical protein VM657_06805 [Sphingomonas sp.]|nr:hypothetical protein [Sphingomonas sp.]
MLAGLIFATDDADDRPDKLAATLPFGGGTLLEYQARLLIAAGAAQLLVAVTRLTPELIGAVNRIGGRVPVDVVRSATEAADKAHPLARIIVVADGLVSTNAIVDMLADEGDDALLVTSQGDALPGFERVDANSAWAGLARIGARRLDDVARFPADYDFQSTLLRVLAQGRTLRIALPASAAREGHGIQRDSRALADRSRAVLSSIVTSRPGWFDRLVLAPLARWTLPSLVSRAVPSAVLAGAGAIVALAGLVGLVLDLPVTGLALVEGGIVAMALAAVLGALRGEGRLAKVQGWAIGGASALAALLLGRMASIEAMTATGWTLAIGLVVAGTLLERAARHRRSLWWASALVYPLVLLCFTAAGHPLIGLAVAAAYASASLAAAIERLTAES